ncbi:hypothetical protein AC1031_018732 [Aphanomyces cochlioides]|nr:hypothetical protein AC1031_018732 [Aphanomyces cochlioides]
MESSDGGEGGSVGGRKWWSDTDDLYLLIQTNNDLPFMAEKNSMKAWDALAAKLQTISDFTRIGIDGKKASCRFYALMRAHRKFQTSSKYLSGVEQDETGKIKLLDELVALYDDNEVAKLSEKEKDAGKQAAKESTAHYILDQAMARGRRKATDTSDVSDTEANPSKKK